MDFEWDETRNAINRAKHHVGFEVMDRFDWERSSLRTDNRKDYGEVRFLAYGPIEGLGMHVVAFTVRGDKYRIISLRPFGRKDHRYYEPPLPG